MAVFLHTLLATLFVVQAAVLAKRGSLQFAVLFFACLYFIYFASAPLIFPGQMRPDLYDALAVSTLFLFAANLSLGEVILLSRRTTPDVRERDEQVLDATLFAGKVTFWIALTMVLGHMAIAGVPVLQTNANLARHELGGSGYIKIFLTRALPLATLMIASVEWQRHGRLLTRRSSGYFLLLFVATFLQGFRIHLIYAVLYFISMRFILRRQLSLMTIGLVGLIAIAIFFILSALRFETSDAGVLLSVFQHRVSFELLRTAGYAMEIARSEGFWHGQSILMDLQSALPGPGISFGDYMLLFVNPQSAIVGLASLTPSIIGEAYVNFGYLGAFVYGWLMVIMMVSAPGFMLRIRGLGLALAAIVPVTIVQSIEVGLGELLASRLIPLGVFAVFAHLLYRWRLGRNTHAPHPRLARQAA